MDDVFKDVTSTLQYDLANRLVKVEQTIAGEKPVVEENFYNGDGQRIRKDVNGLVSKYYYDGDNLLFTTDVNNVKATENVLSPGGQIVASKRFDGAYENMYFFYHYDIRGSVTSILAPDVKRVKGYGYDEFGETEEVGSNSFLNEVKFTGAVHDAATGLYYMNARHYNPDTGRFVSQDTEKGIAANPWSQHLYTYTTNNPINFIDPTGHIAMYIGDDGLSHRVSPYDMPSSPSYNPSKSIKTNSNKTHGISHLDPVFIYKDYESPVSKMEMQFIPGGPLLKPIGQLISTGVKQGAKMLGINTAKGTVKGKNVVYTSTNADDVVQYVGITNNYARRAAEHLRDKGINIQPLMKDLSRSDARAVEQALIEIHGLQKNGGTLMNKINSISIKNPSYAKQLERGHELLKSIGY